MFTIKVLNKEGTYLSIIKVVCDTPTSNIILSGESFSSKARKKTQMSTHTLIFKRILEVLASIGKEKENASKLVRK